MTLSSRSQFDRHADKYAASAVHHSGPSLPVLSVFAEPTAIDRVLDVATGTGSTALSLAPQVATVIGVDVAPKMLDEGRARAERDGIRNVTFMEGAAEQLPFDDSAFTLVTSRHAPHHFIDVAAFLTEVRRVLTPDGRFVLADQITPDGSMFDWVDTWQRLHDPSHHRQRTAEEWHALARAQGFVPTREQIVPYRLDFAGWTQTSGCSSEAKSALRTHAQAASGHVRQAMGLEYDERGDVQAYQLPVLVLRLDPV